MLSRFNRKSYILCSNKLIRTGGRHKYCRNYAVKGAGLCHIYRYKVKKYGKYQVFVKQTSSIILPDDLMIENVSFSTAANFKCMCSNPNLIFLVLSVVAKMNHVLQ